MAVAMHDHIHLDTADPPVETYAVEHGSLDATPGVAVVMERAVTGKLHIHRLESGGNIVQFLADRLQLRATRAEKDTLIALAGKTVYYAPHYHDDDEDGAGSLKAWSAASVYVKRAVAMFQPGSIVNRDPLAEFWFVAIALTDDSAVT